MSAAKVFFCTIRRFKYRQGFSKVRFLRCKDTNRGKPRRLRHRSYTSTAQAYAVPSAVTSGALRPGLRLLKSPEVPIDNKFNSDGLCFTDAGELHLLVATLPYRRFAPSAAMPALKKAELNMSTLQQGLASAEPADFVAALQERIGR